MLHISGTIHQMIVIYVHLYKMIISAENVFIFSKLWFFGLLGSMGGGKRGGGERAQKTVQNDKKFCLSRSISQETYTIWFSCMVQMCQMIISPGAFFNFKNLIFQVARVLKWQKMTQNDKNFYLSYLTFQKPYIIWCSFMVYRYV